MSASAPKADFELWMSMDKYGRNKVRKIISILLRVMLFISLESVIQWF